jgi:protein-S-isoprenylcysteine O-methyltransferase Ste14
MTLRSRALTGLTQFVLIIGALLFGSAWSLRYWQAWLFLAVFGASVTAITVYLLRNDTALLERRLRAGASAEKEKSQKIIQAVANIFFLSLIIVPGLDHRFSWSHLPVWLSVAGDGLVVIGLSIVFLVFRENTYTSGVIEVAPDQRVISTGPYRIVRHPMYAGAFVMIFGVPLALGSTWGLLCCLPLMAAIVMRLKDEERYLVRHLAGYAEYLERTRYRLIPGLY